MRIIQITPGSGDNFYCENCLRDLSLVKAFQRAGHDILMVPLYLPLNLDAPLSNVQSPIFFGGLNVYLQQKLALFRNTPRWLDKLFDSPCLLKSVGRFSGMTSAHDLGQTTVSMLKGPKGLQLKELNRLIDWLKTQPRPDVVVLSNILLSGMASAIKDVLKVPVVCMLQDEDGFLDALPEPYAAQAWNLVRQNAAAFDSLIAVSRWYQQIMTERLEVPHQRIEFIPMGIDASAYQVPSMPPATPTIGFLSRMTHDFGLDILADAFLLLRRDLRLKDLKLRITGGSTARDNDFLSKIKAKLHKELSEGLVDFLPDYDLAARRKFLTGLSIIAAPARKPQAYGMFALEACAAGVPFIAPPTGVFPELAQTTGAGILYTLNTPEGLANALAPLLTEQTGLFQMGQKGRKSVEEVYSIDNTVRKMSELFGGLPAI